MNISLDPTSQTFLTNVSRLQRAANLAQEQLSSGYKVEQASDAPDQIGALLQLEANLSSNAQVSTNLSNVKAFVDGGENALSTAVQLAQSVVSLGAQGASSIATTSTRQTLAQQVQDALSQFTSLANTTVAGKYIFSGDAGTVPSYQLDSTSPTGVTRLITTQSTQQIQDSNGATFPIAKTAEEIFDRRNPDDTLAPGNVFAAVSSLQTALANDDTAGINSALDSLHQASDYLNTQLAFYGNAQTRVASATTAAQTQNVALKAQISAIRDADPAEAALAITQTTTNLTAAYSAESKRSKNSLFDYLG